MTQAFNLSQLANKVNTSGLLNAAAGLYNQTPVANGGTGKASVTSGTLLLGAGTAAMTELTGGTVGNVVTWNGSTWTSATGAGGPAPVVTIYRSPSPWTKPAILKAVRVTVLSGGGGGAGCKAGPPAASPATGGAGGGAAGGVGYFPAASIPGPQTVSVGSAGSGGSIPAVYSVITPGSAGGTSSFGSFISATGGGAGTSGAGAAGSITVGPTVQGYTGTDGVLGSPYKGGDSYQVQGFGGGATPQPSGRFFGNPGIGYGAGGGGSYMNASPLPSIGSSGGNGTQGYVIVEEFY